MKYLLIAICLISCSVNAQQLIVKQIRVVCDAGQSPKIFNNPVDADNYAKTLPCATNNWVEMNYRYVRVSSSSSAKSSSSSTTSSSSSSSSLSVPVVSASCPKIRANGDALRLEEIGGYDLRCDGKHEIFTQKQCAINYVTLLPVSAKKCEIAAYDTKGVYSDFEAFE